MNDCFWAAIGACDGFGCGACAHYVSLNSDEGEKLSLEYSEMINEILPPFRDEFAKIHGFKESSKEEDQ